MDWHSLEINGQRYLFGTQTKISFDCLPWNDCFIYTDPKIMMIGILPQRIPPIIYKSSIYLQAQLLAILLLTRVCCSDDLCHARIFRRVSTKFLASIL